ncbi:hypothetical protein CHGG_04668 [Chaetomium globosum CBS 148.51]|jgi:large subunit ribosomal protein L23|uniref:Large ribosomal subunit protein uL23m n=1 Tax=Chaetomium globosum (strain ATCC 6205 / CBS 148.51 / DSM 1962 / NBRC 6347 / NRRL 1970) TaxID=306901 RepID=Q2H0M8_CHAGB|nr:uncharacterized protein CHGG_04668 [Chaetomium globosum CBS 148.51]EAQ88049.1 hypothetical protein CHGG_04668 [Chaetomium globosum CBS 148.51]
MTTPLAAAAETVTKQLPRRFGNKQIFLPNHVIAFIRPKDKQPPNLATFVVPLNFNKFDLRDYLYHAYNVEVTSVRSFINQPAPKQKFVGVGRMYRPRSQKMMIVELLKPFVWPARPDDSELDQFDYKMFQQLSKERSAQVEQQKNAMSIPLRSHAPAKEDRVRLRKQAADIVERGEWKNKNDDDGWTEVDADVKI